MMPVLIKIGAALALLVALVAGYKAWESHIEARGFERGRAEVQAAWDKENAQRTRHALVLSESNRTEEARREAEKVKSAHDAQNLLARARADAAGADRAAGSLRGQLAVYVADARARGAAPNSQPVAGGAPASDATGVLADLFQRADTRAGVLAKALDAAFIAGRTCEREHDTLTP